MSSCSNSKNRFWAWCFSKFFTHPLTRLASYLMMSSCSNLRIASELDVLPSFSPISLHDLLHATSDGFGSFVSWFLLLGLSFLHFVLSIVNFGPFFFLLLFPCWVFFLYLFICLFCLSFVEISQLTCCSPRAQTETDFHPGSRSYWL